MGEPIPLQLHVAEESRPQITKAEVPTLPHDNVNLGTEHPVRDEIQTQFLTTDVTSIIPSFDHPARILTEMATMTGMTSATQDMPTDVSIQDSIDIQVQLIPEQQPSNTGIALPSHLHHSSATHITESAPLYSSDNLSSDAETQSLSWNELTLEMLADIVSQQVIRVTHLDEVAATRMVPCYHMTGMKWKEILDMIIHTHNTTCSHHNGVVFNQNAVKIGVMLESGGGVKDMKSIFNKKKFKNVSVQTEDIENTIIPDGNKGSVTYQLSSSTENVTEHVHCRKKSGSTDNANDEIVDSSNENNDAGDGTSEISEYQGLPDYDVLTEKDNTLDFDIPVKGFPPQCQICKKTFKTRTSLKRHAVVHQPGHNQYPCTFCDKVCKTKCYLERHMATHTKPVKERTRKPYVRKIDKKHAVIKRKNSPATCQICKKTFKFFRNLTRHEKIHSKQNQFPCKQCDKVCKTAYYLKLHMMVHSEEKQYKCPECDLSFGRKDKLKQHRSRVHQTYEEHSCVICGKMYKNKETLNDHMIEHESKKSYLCETCGKTFLRPSIYRLHVSYHVARSDPNGHKCSHCPKAYHSRSLLNKHVRYAHLKERNYKCNVCGTGFFTKQQQVSHEQVHREKTTHVCTFCSKGFAQKHTLLAHSRIHTGYRPFICKFCNKGFTSKGLLVKHVKIHTIQEKTERSFQCDQCPAAFTNKTSLSDHRKRHAGIKDHKCEFCNVAFVTRGDLVRHLRTHTGGKPFKCKLCGERFQKKLELTEHEVTHGFVEVPITVTLIPEQQ